MATQLITDAADYLVPLRLAFGFTADYQDDADSLRLLSANPTQMLAGAMSCKKAPESTP